MIVDLRLDPASPAGVVLAALRDRIDPESVPMLIGAEARDVLHASLGHTFANRATDDVDLAFALPNWRAFERLVDGLVCIADTGIAFRVDGVHVDIIAFGPIESPQGKLRPPFRPSDPLDVFGMTQVYQAAHHASVGEGLEVRVPSSAGYVALKLKAWIDRSAMHNHKDAPDLGLALYWAAESRSITDRVWADPELVGRWHGDVGLAGAAIIGADARVVLGSPAAAQLAALFTFDSRELLSRVLQSVPRDFGLGDQARRRALLDALVVGLATPHRG